MPRIEFGRAVNSIKSAFKEEDAEARAEKIVEEIKTGVNQGRYGNDQAVIHFDILNPAIFSLRFGEAEVQYAIKPQFDDAMPFSEGLARVAIGDRWGYIDKSGEYVINLQFDDAKSFEDGLACVKIDGKYGYISKSSFRK